LALIRRRAFGAPGGFILDLDMVFISGVATFSGLFLSVTLVTFQWDNNPLAPSNCGLISEIITYSDTGRILN
jgi:hypothetical protein